MKHNLKLLLFVLISLSIHQTVIIAQNPDPIKTEILEMPYNGQTSITALKYGMAAKPYDCEPWEEYSDWAPQNTGDKECDLKRFGIHDWVYAEFQDVNATSMIQTLQYCVCGCDNSANEARICRYCKRHETRVKSWGYRQVDHKSEYLDLVKDLKKN